MKYRVQVACLVMVMILLGGGQVWGAPGDPLWEKSFNYLENDLDTTRISAVAGNSKTLIVTGSASKSTNFSTSLGFIRAYDAETGDLKWQDTLTLASTQGAHNGNVFGNIIISGNVAMVQGTALSTTFNNEPPYQTVNLDKVILRAYNINTGQILWENSKDGSANANMSGTNTGASNSIVFTFGGGGISHDVWVRAYRIPSISTQGLSLLLE